MPAPQYLLPQSLGPIQLYRHLLREASYLPPAFRKPIDSMIRKRFHNNRPDGPHTKRRLSKAMSSLRTLRAANSGDRGAMEGLMLKGFGRTGFRRRELMTKLVKPQGPSDTLALESLLDKAAASNTPGQASADGPGRAGEGETCEEEKGRSSKTAFFQKWDQPKLLQIMRSQKKQQEATRGTTSWHSQFFKNVNPDQHVPKTNVWGNAPAASLVQTKLANWWKRNASKIMPPLGRGEWDLLHDLSQGAQDAGEWAIPSRRLHPRPTEPAGSSESFDQWDWEAYAAAPTARVELPRAASRQRRTGQEGSGPYCGHSPSRELSGRWFRRAYGRTWQLTPSMEQDPNTLKFDLKWGSVAPKLPCATASQMQIFEGVNQQGKALRGESGDQTSDDHTHRRRT